MKKHVNYLQILFFVLFILSLLVACEKKEELTYLKGMGSVTDIDGNSYKTVIIGHPFLDMGTQEWMAENLKVTRFSDGSSIPLASNANEWHVEVQNSNPHFAWSHYSPQDQGTFYGALYNFHATVDTRGLCPDGWRVSTRSDWEKLCTILGGHEAGGKLKSTDSAWDPPNVDATNELLFDALPAGLISGNGDQIFIGEMAWFWTTTSFDAGTAYAFHLNSWDEIVGSSPQTKWEGRSIRCVKEN
jgi:uncharacterized protein (TIGR02145 family)